MKKVAKDINKSDIRKEESRKYDLKTEIHDLIKVMKKHHDDRDKKLRELSKRCKENLGVKS